jgi:hypothetical protein
MTISLLDTELLLELEGFMEVPGHLPLLFDAATAAATQSAES